MENIEEDGKKINIVTRYGDQTKNDITKQNEDIHKWVRKNVEPEHKFDVFKEKDIFKESR